MECGVWNAECGMWNAECGEQRLPVTSDQLAIAWFKGPNARPELEVGATHERCDSNRAQWRDEVASLRPGTGRGPGGCGPRPVPGRSNVAPCSGCRPSTRVRIWEV